MPNVFFFPLMKEQKDTYTTFLIFKLSMLNYFYFDNKLLESIHLRLIAVCRLKRKIVKTEHTLSDNWKKIRQFV